MNYQSTFTLSIAEGQTTPWDFNLTMLPHPCYLAYWEGTKAYEPTAAANGAGMMWNTQLVEGIAAPTSPQLVAAWLQVAHRWRLCFMSVTVLQDGPDLANQGTIVVSQSPLEPRYWSVPAVSNLAGNTYATTRLAQFDYEREGPNFNRSQTMPNAMLGKSRDGAYVPLKLTDTCQNWYSLSDLVVPFEGNTTAVDPLLISQIPAAAYQCYPFHSTDPAHGTASSLHGSSVPGLLNGNVAHICARNLSAETSFTFQFRVGIEIQLAPSSILTPQLKLSPPYDPTALDTYFSVSRELKDGYPADYNDWGKLWDIISDAIKTAAPTLRMIPGAHFVEPVVRAGVRVGDAVRRNRQAGRAKDKPSAAQVEAVQAVKNAASVMRNPAQAKAVKSMVKSSRAPNAGRGRRPRRSRR